MFSHNCQVWNCGGNREYAQWEGVKTIHCIHCGELFLSIYAYDTHRVSVEEGEAVCENLVTFKKQDGSQEFERVSKPGWTPDYAWTYVKVIDLSAFKFRNSVK